MSDLISRDAVLKVLNNSRSIRTKHDGARGVWIDLLDATDGILRIPTVEPVQHGTWKPVQFGVNVHITAYHGCSACGCVFKAPSRYCPNCGAKMDGGAGNENRDR